MLNLQDDYEEDLEKSGITPMTDSELVSACMNEISRGIGGTVSSDNDADISLPLDYYLGRLPGLSKSRAKDVNASRYVSMDVMDAVEATVSEIMPAFTTDQIAFYEPIDEGDEDQAKIETELVNYLFMEEYDGYTLLQVALKDALLHRNCTAKAYWDERKQVEYETVENVPEMALPMVLQPTQEDQEVEVIHQEVTDLGDPSQVEEAMLAAEANPEAVAMAMQTPQGQQIVQQAQMEAQDKYTIKIKRTTVIGKPVIDSIAPEQVIVSGDHTSPYLQDVRFVAHENLETQSSLIEQGFDPEIVNKLSDYNNNVEDLSRSRETDEYDYDSAHRSTRQIRVFECYPLIDFDGDGIAERRKVVISSQTLLSNEEWGAVPLIGGVATVMPHKYKGISMFDRLKSIQDSKTPVIRAIVDGTQLSSNPRVGIITGEVNLEDLLTSRTGGTVRMETAGSVVPLPNPEVPASSYSMLEYMDAQRSERGGSAVGTSTQAQKISGDTAHGIERVMSAMELNNAVMARSIGETFIRGIFIQLHEILRDNHEGPLSAKVGGRWLTTNPKDWRKRTNVSVQIGSSYSERARQANVMQGVVALHKELAAVNSIMFDEDKAFAAITDAINLSGVRNGESYFVDPESEEGKQKKAIQDQEKQQAKQKQEAIEGMMLKAQTDIAQAELTKGQADMYAQQVKLQLESQKQQSENASNLLKLQLENAQAEAQAYKDGAQSRFNYEKLVADTSVKIMEMSKVDPVTADDNAEVYEEVAEEIEE